MDRLHSYKLATHIFSYDIEMCLREILSLILVGMQVIST